MNKTATVYNSIEKLRAAWPEWDFCKVSLGGPPVELVAERLRGERLVLTAMRFYEADAARAIAAELIAAGYPPKEKE